MFPIFVEGGPHNPMGARGIYLYQGSKDTLFRIHGTNQPEYIGQAISSGCIRMTNEDVIDLYNRVKMGAIVVVLAPKQGDSPFSPRGGRVQIRLTEAIEGAGSGAGRESGAVSFLRGIKQLNEPLAPAPNPRCDRARGPGDRTVRRFPPA